MKKQGKHRKNRKASSNKSKPSVLQTPNENEHISQGRRSFLRNMRMTAVAISVVGAVGYYSISSIQASLSEADLSKIGNGRPAIVQIHDPQCMLCRTLQSQTRDVLDAYDDERFEYLVANIKTKKGGDLAARYSVPHVTLLLFDPKGTMVRAVRGPTSTAHLKNIIGIHIDKYS